MARTSTLVGALALALLLLLACSSPSGPRERRVIGTIEFFDDPVVISLPDTAAAGEPFTATVRTYGGGCTRKGDTEVDVDGLRANVIPFDIETVGDQVVCPAVLVRFQHSATITFEEPGTGDVIVQGRREPENELFTVERTVVVR